METTDRERRAETMSTHLSALESGAFSPTSQVELLVKTFIVIMRTSRRIKYHKMQAELLAVLLFCTFKLFLGSLFPGSCRACSLGSGDWLQQFSAEASHGNVEAACCCKIHDHSKTEALTRVLLQSSCRFRRFRIWLLTILTYSHLAWLVHDMKKK